MYSTQLLKNIFLGICVAPPPNTNKATLLLQLPVIAIFTQTKFQDGITCQMMIGYLDYWANLDSIIGISQQ